MSQKIKSNLIFYLQFWPVLVTIIGCGLYVAQNIAVLTTRVTDLEKQVDILDAKVDRVLIGAKGEKPVQFSKPTIFSNE